MQFKPGPVVRIAVRPVAIEFASDPSLRQNRVSPVPFTGTMGMIVDALGMAFAMGSETLWALILRVALSAA